jgi:hypothetical protein
MQTCPSCDHQFSTSDRETLFATEENARLRAELVAERTKYLAYVDQLEREASELVNSLRAICRATGNESYDEGELIWQEADLVLALHDEDTKIVPTRTRL